MEKSRRSTFQVALACALGALACGLIAALTGFHIGFGLIAGLITGYIAYEFRDVLRAVPVAYRATRRGSLSVYGTISATLRAWRAQPHPLLYPAALIVAPLYIRLMFLMSQSVLSETTSATGKIVMTVVMTVGAVVGFFEAAWVAMLPLFILAFIGSRVGERRYWLPFGMLDADAAKAYAALEEKGYQRTTLTYRIVGRWIAKGAGYTVLFFAWTLWKYLIIAVAAVVTFLARFLWTVFKLIHSHERVLCALDGTIGGTVAYQFFISPERSIAHNAVAVAFGMVLGVAFGLVNYEIVSKRVLKVVPVTASGDAQ